MPIDCRKKTLKKEGIKELKKRETEIKILEANITEKNMFRNWKS